MEKEVIKEDGHYQLPLPFRKRLTLAKQQDTSKNEVTTFEEKVHEG